MIIHMRHTLWTGISETNVNIITSATRTHAFNNNNNQFGFKRKHGTDQCIYVLKEIIDMYRKLNGSVFVCFLEPVRHLTG